MNASTCLKFRKNNFYSGEEIYYGLQMG